MERINIQLEIWEDAATPICTEKVNLDAAEQLLYQSMKIYYGYTDEDIQKYLKDGPATRERDRWCERLCKEEEAVIIECGGVYYEDLDKDSEPTIHDAVENIKRREQVELAEAVRKFGKKTPKGYEFRFKENSPIIAAYSNDEPCDIIVLAVMLEEYELPDCKDIVKTKFTLLATEKGSGFQPKEYMPDEAFAGQLEYVTSDLIAQAKQ